MPKEVSMPELPESLRNGVYANFFSISLGGSEAIIDFGSMLPPPQAISGKPVPPSRTVIVSRVIISVEGARKLRDLLDGLLKESPSP